MRALVVGLSFAIAPGSAGLASPAPITSAVEVVPATGQLLKALREKLAADEGADRGIFHEDISALVAPYFAPPMTLADAQRKLREQGLPPLQRFHGTADRVGETIFVSRLDLTPEVYAVLDFDFDGTSEAQLRLRQVTAYLASSTM